MSEPMKALAKRNLKPMLPAFLIWAGLIAWLSPRLRLETSSDGLLLAGGLLLSLCALSVLFAGRVRSHLDLLQARLSDLEPNRRRLLLFVGYKEAVKAIFGSSLMLAWLAGLLYLGDHRAELPVPALLGLAYSAAVFLPAWLFSRFLDAIPYPGS